MVFFTKREVKKKQKEPQQQITNRSERSQQDLAASMGIGIAATRGEERIMAATGLLAEAPTVFAPHNNVMNAGVLFSLPALLSQGLLKSTSIYEPLPKGFYSFVHILLLLAFMALSRIKNPEQLKKSPPGELGKVLGLNRIPEAKCLREKLSLIVSQEKAENFERILSKEWITSEECLFFYINGHVRVNHGYQANLPKKFVSRQKLCLPGTTEYWGHGLHPDGYRARASLPDEHAR